MCLYFLYKRRPLLLSVIEHMCLVIGSSFFYVLCNSTYLVLIINYNYFVKYVRIRTKSIIFCFSKNN